MRFFAPGTVCGTLVWLALLAAGGQAVAQSPRDEAGGERVRPRASDHSRANDRKASREEPADVPKTDVAKTDANDGAAADAPAPRKISRTRDAAPTDASGKSRPVGSGFGVVGPLALVLIVALMVAALWKRHGSGLTPGLPREAVDVLGRRPLDPRTTLWLVRLGSRILVLGVTPGGVQSLTEVNNPAEVDLLTGLCKRRGPGDKPVESFQMLFGQLATGPKPGVETRAADGGAGDAEGDVGGEDERGIESGPSPELFARRFQRSTTARDAEDYHGT